ncbi:deiodinase family protein [Planctomyces sp. SH-PL62]|uniref:deiodinase family protein n=1 Tax=Planctomyces sp. SH-PL62 TaxID=1636152 RepID=UPI00078C3DD6|nr:deiodinase family protein [Planctomyces sp. SH-PL62]AMV39907.1 Iodothyronine deiodinase [Planctomyces sp. SH-PL62]
MLVRTSLHAAILTAGLGLSVSAIAEEPSKPQAAAPATAADESSRALREAWPDRPEWLDMYTAILSDEPMGPTNGWFRTSVTQTRYGWDAVRARFDRDGDGKVARAEYPGDDESFARLDRDRDAGLTQADFDFSRAYMPSPGSMLFSRLDRDGDGKVVREEIERFFKAADADDAGFLSRMDLERALPAPSGSMGPGDRPTKEQLIKGLFRQEIGSLQSGPNLDETAPDFSLKTADGQGELTLSKLVGPKPVVLIFGNFTCGPFRSMAGNFEKLHRRYGDRATFVMVYVREAHPSDGWRMQSNESVGVSTAQPRTYEERAEVAQRCGKLLSLGFPMLVDTIDDAVGARYSGMPGRFYLIDTAGKIAFKNARGPFGFKPAELEQSLILLLQDEGSTGDQARSEVR